jgi:hypothetical protein
LVDIGISVLLCNNDFQELATLYLDRLMKTRDANEGLAAFL